MRPRFSIARLIVVIVACGVVFAALRSPSNLWANALYSAAFGALLVGLIRFALTRGRVRAFWAGFLIVGWAYFAVYAVPMLRDSVGPRLLTEPLMDLIYPLISPKSTPPAPTWGATGSTAAGYAGGGSSMSGMMLMMGSGGAPHAPAAQVTPWLAWTEPDRTSGVGYRIGNVALVSSETFRQIGHAALTLLLAALGGLYARATYDRIGADRPPTGPTSA